MARIGIMSFAHMHAESYAACIPQVPGAELAAIWDDDTHRGRNAAGRHRTEFIDDMDAFLDAGIDAVIVTSENVKHRAMVERAAGAGKWILCEKPIATTVEDAQAMIDACKAAGVGLGTAFPVRFAQPILQIKHQFDAGTYGAFLAASCTNNGSFPGGWFAELQWSGGGATMDHTVHVVDVLRWLTGREFTKVYCENGRLHGKSPKLDDVGCLQLEMEGGIVVSHIASWNRASSFPTWGDVTLQIIAEKGVIDVDAFNQKINVYSDAVGKHVYAPWADNPDLGLVADFVAAVHERRDPCATGYDGLKATEVTVAAYESARTGRAVEL